MNEQKNLRVIFTEKAESTFADVLKSNGLEETDEEFDEYLLKEKESRAMIVRDALEVLAKKIVPENKLIELLQKHLNISEDVTKKLIDDIKNRILPLLLICPDEKFNNSAFREEIAKKIGEGEESRANQRVGDLLNKIKNQQSVPHTKEKNEPAMPYKKRPQITDVEENAEKIQKEKKPIISGNRAIERPQPPTEIKPDPYKEPIE